MVYLKVSQKMQQSNLFRMNKVEGSATQNTIEQPFIHRIKNKITSLWTHLIASHQ